MRLAMATALLFGVLAGVGGTARADFIDDDAPRAAELAQKRHYAEVRRLEAWLSAGGLSEREVARRLAAMDDEDIHRACSLPETLWLARVTLRARQARR